MADPLTLKDYFLETRIIQSRLLWLLVVILFMTSVLVARYYELQINRHDTFVTLSDANRILTQSVAPTRGLIFDRQGKILAENQPSFSLNIVQERVADLDATLLLLQQLLSLSDKELEKFQQRLQKRRRPYEPVPIRFRLSDEEIAIIAVNEYRLPGVEVKGQLVRHYPYGDLFAHSIGYVGSINVKEQRRINEQGLEKSYEGIYSIGKTGIERIYESLLLGESGAQKVETNARGRVLRVLEQELPEPGDNLTLFLDAELQRIAAEQLKEHRGAIVAIEVDSGGVLAAFSAPAFDPNLFVTGISVKNYAALRDSWKLPLFNRVLQGQYPPGSTIKPMVGLSGLEHHVITPQFTINDPGYYQLPNDERLYRNWKREGHGSNVDLKQAIAESSDTYYYDLAYRLGIDRMSAFLAEFGFGEKTHVDQTSERSGLLPSREWKRKYRQLHWFPGDSLNVGIGQGDMLATPMQLAYATTVVANRGLRIQPRMLNSVNGQQRPAEVAEPLVLQQDENWDVIIDAMEEVVHGRNGTARGIGRGLEYRMAGKTGTAQVVGIKQGEEYDASLLDLQQRDHALFIAFAPIEAPKIAVAVVVENGEAGSTTAAPMARAVIDHYLLQQKTTQALQDSNVAEGQVWQKTF